MTLAIAIHGKNNRDAAPGMPRPRYRARRRSAQTDYPQLLALSHGTRTHLTVQKDAPDPRAVQHPERGCVVAMPEAGGIHHWYERRVA